MKYEKLTIKKLETKFYLLLIDNLIIAQSYFYIVKKQIKI